MYFGDGRKRYWSPIPLTTSSISIHWRNSPRFKSMRAICPIVASWIRYFAFRMSHAITPVHGIVVCDPNRRIYHETLRSSLFRRKRNTVRHKRRQTTRDDTPGREQYEVAWYDCHAMANQMSTHLHRIDAATPVTGPNWIRMAVRTSMKWQKCSNNLQKSIWRLHVAASLRVQCDCGITRVQP